MDDLGKSIPAAEAMIDAEHGPDGKSVNETCLNCGTKLIDSYCHHCGQKDIPRRQTLGELLINFISSFWSYEGKFFRTTRYLITSPGFLASEYNAGRRESYFHPARMYVFISFVFFLVYFSIPDDDDNKIEMDREDIEDMRKDMKDEGVDTIAGFRNLSDSMLVVLAPAIQDSIEKRDPNVTFSGVDQQSVAEYDSVEATKAPEERDGWLGRKINIRVIELRNRYANKDGQFLKDFGQSFNDNFSKVLFWLLPFFALVLKLLYIRRDFYYSEHLVLSIYYYNFFYLAGSLIMLVGLMPGMGFVNVAIGFWIYFYLLFAMKHMYKQTWGKTILKFITFSFVFGFLMGIGFLISVIAVLMLI